MNECDTRREWIRRLAAQARGDEAPPAVLFLYITERCNLRCSFCSFTVNPCIERERELTDEAWMAVARQAALWPRTMAYLVGGEIFLRKPLVLDLMATLSGGGLVGNLTTNGVLLDPPDLERIVEMGWDTMVFSLDGARPETHDSLRGRDGLHRKLTDTIRRLIEIRRTAGSDRPVVMLHMVVHNRNFRELPEMVRLASDLGVFSLNVEFLSAKTPACNDLMIPDGERDRLQDAIARSMVLAGEVGLTTGLGRLRQPGVEAGATAATVQAREELPCRNSVLRAACFVPWTYITVHPDGKLATCWRVRAEDAPRAGTTSLQDWWGRGTDLALRDRLLRGEPLDVCRECCSHLGLETRLWRALALAQIGAPEARAHLEAWAHYDPQDPLVREESERLAAAG